jgi:hypothetical protein
MPSFYFEGYHTSFVSPKLISSCAAINEFVLNLLYLIQLSKNREFSKLIYFFIIYSPYEVLLSNKINLIMLLFRKTYSIFQMDQVEHQIFLLRHVCD